MLSIPFYALIILLFLHRINHSKGIIILFNSYEFILLFLPISICLYYLLGKADNPLVSKSLLLVLSYVFIAYSNLFYLYTLLLSSTVNYLCNRIIKSRQSMSRIILSLGIIFNVALLGYFKYTNFFIESLNLTFRTDIPTANILLPLGISFYTFQQIAYLVDNYSFLYTIKSKGN